MIIKKLLELCLSLLTSLLSNVGSIPALPDQVLTIFQTVINYMVSGIDLLGMFIGPTALTFVGVCLDVIIALNLFYFGYSCVMWFLHCSSCYPHYSIVCPSAIFVCFIAYCYMKNIAFYSVFVVPFLLVYSFWV